MRTSKEWDTPTAFSTLANYTEHPSQVQIDDIKQEWKGGLKEGAAPQPVHTVCSHGQGEGPPHAAALSSQCSVLAQSAESSASAQSSAGASVA